MRFMAHYMLANADERQRRLRALADRERRTRPASRRKR